MNASTRWAMRLSVMALALSVMAVFWVWAVKTTPCASAQATCPIALTRVISQGLTVNEDGADSDSRLEGDTNINLQYWDATTDSIGLGAVQVTGAFLGVTGYTTNRAGVTSVGREFHAPAGTFTQTNAASTTLAVGARYFVGAPTFAGSNATQVLTDAFTALYDAPAAGTNMTLTRAYTMGLSASTTGTLWVSRDTDSTTAAGGLLFGLSRDVNLYRSAADTLRTDDTFNANTALLEAGNAVPNATDNLGFFAATTSAQLAGVISDETGSGALLFATSPTMAGTWAGAVTFSGSTITFSGGTASTSTSTGTIVISGSGGFAVGGSIWTADQLNFTSTASGWTVGGTRIYKTAGSGLLLGGTGTTNDVIIVNTSGNAAIQIPTGTTRVSLPDSTASTSTTTGALVVTGGVGAGGAIYAGGLIQLQNNTYLRGWNAAGTVQVPLIAIDASDVIQIGDTGYTTKLRSTTASTSTTTGTLVVTGGAGVGGALYLGGLLAISSGINEKIGATTARATTEATNALYLFDGTAPVGTLANGISLYSTTGELRVMDSAGNATLLSPHDNLTNEWIFDSVNTATGKTLKIDMERLVKAVNAEFGWNFVQEYSGSKPLIDAAGRQIYERRQKRGGDGKLLYEPMTETVTIEVEAATTSTPAKTRQEQRIMTRKQSAVVTKEVEIPVGQSGRFVKGKHDTIEERDVPIDDLTKPIMEDAAVMEAIYVPLPQTTVSTTIVELRAQLAVLQARLAALEAKVP